MRDARTPATSASTSARRRLVAPETGPEHDRVGAGRQREHLVGVARAVHHELGAADRNLVADLGRDGREDDSGTRAQRGARREQRCAAGARSAADDEDGSGVVLRPGGIARRERCREIGGLDPQRGRSRLERVRQPDRDRHDLAGVRAPGLDRSPELAPVEADRAVGPDRHTGHLAGRRVDAARNIEREHGRTVAVDPLDRVRDRAARRALRAGAEQRVDHDVRADETRAVWHAELVGDVQHRGGISAEALTWRREHDPHVETRVA